MKLFLQRNEDYNQYQKVESRKWKVKSQKSKVESRKSKVNFGKPIHKFQITKKSAAIFKI